MYMYVCPQLAILYIDKETTSLIIIYSHSQNKLNLSHTTIVTPKVIYDRPIKKHEEHILTSNCGSPALQ